MAKELAFGLATLAIAGGYYSIAAALADTQLADAVGPRGLPKAYAILLGTLSLILILRGFARRRSSDLEAGATARVVPVGQTFEPASTLLRAIGVLLIGIAYVALVPWLGYAIALAGLIAATTYYQGGVLNRQVAIVAVAGAGFFWFMFVWLLQIRQPAGVWSSLF